MCERQWTTERERPRTSQTDYTRFTGIVSTENRISVAAYPRTQYVPPWDSVPHPKKTARLLPSAGAQVILRIVTRVAYADKLLA